jgi:hypothetical protein
MGLGPIPLLGSPKFSTTDSTARTALHVARNTKTSQSIRDQVKDHLITPKNSALILIDYQLPQVAPIVSMDRRLLVENIVVVAGLAKLYAR